MNKNIRILCFIFALTFVIPIFAACGNEKDDVSSAVETTDETVDRPDPPAPKIPKKEIPSVDYGGYEFTILCNPRESGAEYDPSYDYMVAGQKGRSPFIDAVYDRNFYLEKKYNVKIRQKATADLVSEVRTQVMSGKTDFDVIVGKGRQLASLAKEKLFLDLDYVEEFDLNEKYWDRNSIEQLKIGNHYYMANCDFNMQELGCVLFFNNDLIKELGLTSPYEYVENDNWTLDTFAELVKAANKDLDNDGKAGLDDRYGIFFDGYTEPKHILYGCGIRATETDENGNVRVTLLKDKERTVSAFDTIKELFSEKNALNVERASGRSIVDLDLYSWVSGKFQSGNLLFFCGGTSNVLRFRDTHSFGFVPIPKYDKAQKDYYSLYPVKGNLIALPASLTGDDLERTAHIFEDLNYSSNEMCQKYWYHDLASRPSYHDEECEKYLDLIKSSRVYDISLLCDFGGINSNILSTDFSFDLTTAYKRHQKAIDADIKEFHSKTNTGTYN